MNQLAGVPKYSPGEGLVGGQGLGKSWVKKMQGAEAPCTLFRLNSRFMPEL